VNKDVKKLIRAALLTALALGIHALEARIPPLIPAPGVKLGLSNIVTLYALYTLGAPWAVMITLARIILGSLLGGGFSAMLYSLAGGAASVLVALALCKPLILHNPPRNTQLLFVVGAFAGVSHNAAQLAVAVAVTKTPALAAYLPMLIIAGVITGVFTGLCAGFAVKRIRLLR
jgi:heptaprenyl diphosphate synthase